ncbi:chaplin [Streptomyces sp. NPDC001492]
MKKMLAVAAIACAVVLSGAGLATADANGEAKNSPGIVAGNLIQAPVHVPVNATGALNVVGILNPTFSYEDFNS